jgi:hypothetical protein
MAPIAKSDPNCKNLSAIRIMRSLTPVTHDPVSGFIALELLAHDLRNSRAESSVGSPHAKASPHIRKSPKNKMREKMVFISI